MSSVVTRSPFCPQNNVVLRRRIMTIAPLGATLVGMYALGVERQVIQVGSFFFFFFFFAVAPPLIDERLRFPGDLHEAVTRAH